MLTAVTTQDVRSQGWCRSCPEAIGGVELAKRLLRSHGGYYESLPHGQVAVGGDLR